MGSMRDAYFPLVPSMDGARVHMQKKWQNTNPQDLCSLICFPDWRFWHRNIELKYFAQA